MSINSFLTDIGTNAIIRDSEKASIKTSIDNLRTKLHYELGSYLNGHFIFGSYSRQTILPRSMDGNSDIDYMVVFSNTSYKPQTYLNELRKFVEKYYSQSEIYQSNPTIVLELNHIKFELVPAIGTMYPDFYNIPAKASEYQDWIMTSPNDINDSLTKINQANSSLIKPLIRVLKCWNANAGYPFDSFDLEQQIMKSHPAGGYTAAQLLKYYFYTSGEFLSLSYEAAQWRKDKLEKLKSTIRTVRSDETNYPYSAQAELEKLFS